MVGGYPGQVILWDDLENDLISDRIIAYTSTAEFTSLTVNLMPTSFIKGWELHGKTIKSRNDYLSTGDFDRNGVREIYIFTCSSDSILLHSVRDFRSDTVPLQNRFISRVGLIEGKSDAEIIMGEMDDLNDDGFLELIFAVTTGESIFPRAVFAYDIRNDSLWNSPKMGMQIQGLTQIDGNGDGKKEIYLKSYAPANITESGYPYSDSSCWLMALDAHLQFSFLPVKYPGIHSNLLPAPLPVHGKAGEILAFWKPSDSLQNSFYIDRYNFHGRRLSRDSFPGIEKKNGIFGGEWVKTSSLFRYMIPVDVHQYIGIDSSGKLVRVGVDFQFGQYFCNFDLDKDGKTELIMADYNWKQITILRNDLTEPVLVPVAITHPHHTSFSLVRQGQKPSQLCISTGDTMCLIEYGKHPRRNLNWLVPAGLFILIYILTLLIRKTQRLQFEKRLKTEKKITELQLKIVRNQMDPHFTMNAINAVIDAVNREEKELARDNLLHFSKMYRSLVLSADKIKRSLREEIEFTENYLALEQFRFRDRFRYVIDIQPDLDMSVEVPKMVIQSPVENAVKHGLQKKGSAGEVRILIRKEEKLLVIEVTDNGVGRALSAELGTSGTGKGMEMMNQFFGLYHRITGVKVHSTVDDLRDEEGKPAGTRVVVEIYLSG